MLYKFLFCVTSWWFVCLCEVMFPCSVILQLYGHNFLFGRLWQIYESRLDNVSLRWDHYTPWRARIENVSHWYEAKAISVYVSKRVSDYVRACVFVHQTNGPLCSVRVYLASQGCGAAGFGVQTGHYFYLGREASAVPPLLHKHTHTHIHTSTFISPQICRLIFRLSQTYTEL